MATAAPPPALASTAMPAARRLHLGLGMAFALAVGVGNAIGAGIMRTPGVVADQLPVAWLLIALWAMGGLHALLSVNVAAELITAIPRAGGNFVAVRAAFGDSLGLLAGWVGWLKSTASIAALAVASANFFSLIFPGLAQHTVSVATISALAIFALNWPGVREGQIAQTLGSLIKVALLVAVIAIAALAAPVPAGAIVAHGGAAAAATALGFAAVITAYQLIWGAYTGWGASMLFVEEDAQALHHIPRAMAISILTITAIYVALNLSLLHALSLPALRGSALPLALVIDHVFGHSGTVLVALLAIIIVAVANNANIMGAPRILFGLGRDGLFLASATRVNRGGTPDVALGVTALLAVALIQTGAFVFLFKLMAALGVFSMFLYEASLFALRRQQPDLPRPFRAICYPWLPGLVCLLDLGLLIAFIAATPLSGVFMAAMIAVCLPVGIVMHRRRRTI